MFAFDTAGYSIGYDKHYYTETCCYLNKIYCYQMKSYLCYCKFRGKTH